MRTRASPMKRKISHKSYGTRLSDSDAGRPSLEAPEEVLTRSAITILPEMSLEKRRKMSSDQIMEATGRINKKQALGRHRLQLHHPLQKHCEHTSKMKGHSDRE